MVKNWLLVQASKVKKFSSEKVLTLTVTRLNQLLVESLAEVMGPRKALQRVFEGGMSLGHEFMIELSAHLDPDHERIPAYGEAAWIMFAGKSPTEQSYETVEIDGETVYIYRWADDDCPFCRNIRFPHRFCQVPAGAYQGASQTWAALMHDGAFHTLAREVKCKATGDERCEFIMVMVRKEVPVSFVQKHMPELFEDIQLGFVDY